MFKINEADLPTLRTRRALLILDLQENLVGKNGIIPVHQPPQLLENVKRLVPEFRRTGTIIWIQSTFEKSRKINDETANCENVITNRQVIPRVTTPARKGAPSTRAKQNSRRMQDIVSRIVERSNVGVDSAELLDHKEIIEAGDDDHTNDESAEDDEDYLSSNFEEHLATMHPGVSASSQVLDSLRDVSNSKGDIVFVKSHYSAFKSGALVKTLRSQLITELFICGALTNMSVFATAMDAARYGYTITLVEDCLGWRSKSRHEQSLKSLDEATGCDICMSLDIIKEISEKKAQKTTKSESVTAKGQPRVSAEDNALGDLMGKLKLESKSSPPSKATKGPARTVKDDKDPGSMMEKLKLESETHPTSKAGVDLAKVTLATTKENTSAVVCEDDFVPVDEDLGSMMAKLELATTTDATSKAGSKDTKGGLATTGLQPSVVDTNNRSTVVRSSAEGSQPSNAEGTTGKIRVRSKVHVRRRPPTQKSDTSISTTASTPELEATKGSTPEVKALKEETPDAHMPKRSSPEVKAIKDSGTKVEATKESKPKVESVKESKTNVEAKLPDSAPKLHLSYRHASTQTQTQTENQDHQACCCVHAKGCRLSTTEEKQKG